MDWETFVKRYSACDPDSEEAGRVIEEFFPTESLDPAKVAAVKGQVACETMRGECPTFGSDRGHPDFAYRFARWAAHFALMALEGEEVHSAKCGGTGVYH